MALDRVQRAIIHELRGTGPVNLSGPRRAVVWVETLLVGAFLVLGVTTLVASEMHRGQPPNPYASADPNELARRLGAVSCLAALVVGSMLAWSIRQRRWFWWLQIPVMLLAAYALLALPAIAAGV
jgi:hypothetical protein